MEAAWVRKRQHLYFLRQSHPHWSKVKLSQEVEGCYTWTKKWCNRFDEADSDDADLFASQSRARHHPPEPIAQEVVDEIIKIRDDPPDGLNRVPGPIPIQYFLARSEDLADDLKKRIPSTTTIWQILDRHQRIYRPPKVEHEPTTRAKPLQVIQIDFKDVSGVEVETPKKMHQVETLNMVDTGTSILIDNPVRTDFTAETVIEALADTFARWGLPERIEFDRDPRFVGAATSGDFPSALMRFASCLGVEYTIHPPHRPDKNAFVERFNRTYKTEAIQIYLPETLQQVKEMNMDFRYHYHFERPNQARTCGNQPPRVAFAQLPTLPKLPDQLDPDAWLTLINGHYFQRRLDASGRFKLGKQPYYVQRSLAKHTALIQVDASQKQLQVFVADQLVKTLPMKGLFDEVLPFNRYLDLIQKEARSEWQRHLHSKIRYTT